MIMSLKHVSATAREALHLTEFLHIAIGSILGDYVGTEASTGYDSIIHEVMRRLRQAAETADQVVNDFERSRRESI